MEKNTCMYCKLYMSRFVPPKQINNTNHRGLNLACWMTGQGDTSLPPSQFGAFRDRKRDVEVHPSMIQTLESTKPLNHKKCLNP